MKELTKNAETSPEATGGYAPKKPSASVRLFSIEDVKRALRRRLLAAEQESDPEKQVEILRKAWPLIRTIRRHGWSSPWALAAASGMCAGLILLAIKAQPKTFIYQAPQTYWRVHHRFSPKQFRMQQVEQGAALEPVVMNSCDDLPWEAGITLKRFEYDYADSCFKTGTLHPERWYSLVRDGVGCPVVPANCQHTTANCDPKTDHIICSGEPNF